jgi:quercetin dioxygenase-like cupin family protein
VTRAGLAFVLAALSKRAELLADDHDLNMWLVKTPAVLWRVKMQADITTIFETTEFAGITAKVINPYPSLFTMLDMTIKPGFGAPAHISATEDKTFIVIEGRLKFLVGDKIEIVEQGTRVQVPRGIVHGFANVGSADARHILVSTPRRHEEFFRDMQNIPDPRGEHRRLLPAIAARHDQAIVGPLP